MVLVLSGCEFQVQPGDTATGSGETGFSGEEEIAGMLQSSTAAWNRGDLEGFLDDYWRSEELTFSGPDGVTRGWGDVRERYLGSYWAPGVSRDSLRFEGIEVVPLGDTHALAMGRYVLFRPEDGGTVSSSGFFSLVLAKLDDRWRIIHDHTSSTPPSEEL